MLAYIIRDDDPAGGYFCAQNTKPDIRIHRRTIAEIRKIEIPDDVWEMAVTGRLPVDEDASNDSTWIVWWQDPKAELVWIR